MISVEEIHEGASPWKIDSIFKFFVNQEDPLLGWDSNKFKIVFYSMRSMRDFGLFIRGNLESIMALLRKIVK